MDGTDKMSKKRLKELEGKLPVHYVKLAHDLVENEMSGNKETLESIAERNNISRTTLWQLRTQNDEFIEYKRLVTRNILESEYDMVASQLLKSIRQHGSVKGIQLYMQLVGELQNKSEVTVKNEGNSISALSTDDLRNRVAQMKQNN